MKKIMAAFAALAMAILMGVTGAAPVSAAPQQASVQAEQNGTLDYGTYVQYTQCAASNGELPCGNWHIRIWSMNGAHNYLFLGETARNVRDVCPADSNHRLVYWRPNGTGPVTKAMGACQDMEWASTGTYEFHQNSF